MSETLAERYKRLSDADRAMYTQMIYPTRQMLANMIRDNGSVRVAHMHDKASAAILTVLEGRDLEL